MRGPIVYAPLRPSKLLGWVRLPDFLDPKTGDRAEAWQRGKICVLSSVAEMELPQQGGALGPTWHVSITQYAPGGNVRPTEEQVERALRAFKMQGAENDNHSSGRAQHYFMPIDPAARRACECKETEEQVTEPDGYRYSRERSR